DGTVYQTNRMETISWHVANNNHYTVGVCVSGDFTYAVPPDTQVGSAARLVAWLMDELDVPEDRIMGHKEYPENDTSCPGETWLKGKKWKDILLSQVQSVRGGGAGARKALNHYMLFWQKPDAWAQQDWEAAVKYIGRFRPTAGFSTDDARAAEYVTIVGGVAGVSYEAEQLLRASGCQVERLAGVDFADTKRILDELADSGRRFLNLPA
ncbi:MAG: N-acetylmuramoyl-L-alanine amidase, partial [Anaerolineae bacterium]